MIRLEILIPEKPNKKCNPQETNGVSNAISFRVYKIEWL